MVIVSAAVPADAAALLTLHRAVLAEGQWFVTEPDELRADLGTRTQLIRDCARSDNSCLLVARRGPRLLGMVQVAGGLLRRTRHLGRIEIMVDAGARHQGVGRKLMEAAIAHATTTRVLRKLELQVMAHNTAAITLYTALGFVEEGRRREQYAFPDGTFRDELLMARPVGPPPA